jgi:3-hydroxy-9,10-secoandrosta-1,3,5(10)-triene-9,17-dione monooxygenase reductase component
VTSAFAAIDPLHFRSVLAQYPTGVCVITGSHEANGPCAMVVGSFTSVSLDPPLVGFFPAKTSLSWHAIRACGSFCVNVLGADQIDLARQFSARGMNQFDGVSYRISDYGHPVLDGVMATIECRFEREHDTGDHSLVLGRVITLSTSGQTKPLLFFQGKYELLTPTKIPAN